MDKSFFDLGIPAHLPIREVVWSYCRLEINHKDLDTILSNFRESMLKGEQICNQLTLSFLLIDYI